MAKKKATSVIDAKKYNYDTIRVRDKSGAIRHSANNGDAIAKAMLLHISGGGTIDQVIKANKLDITTKGKNAGLVRMSVGVSLRGIVNGGDSVKIGKLVVKSLKQAIAMPKVEAKVAGKKPVAKKAKTKKSAPRKPRTPKAKPQEASTTGPEASAQG